jgi:transcriptional regulator with XRE-family HTH domain
MVTFGDRLRELRTEAGLSHEQLAERSGLPEVSLYAYEKGSSGPSLHNLQRLARALKVSLAEFQDCAPPADRRHRNHTGMR